ncbi:hypothetical protein KC343_g12529 [Hortaea werneckii]|uniref:Uncharacterized protein n=1 Tax=Hortaea werneckii TaxID=91943 RepID=A0A3M7D7E2_HORWE|nr:hypothetical protein KC352_g23147 [Hortaea werneckii]KAI7555795.1 hypothetical protein KC317_g12706 [Hortaea werneckii]KAI7600569.1 hypothetical protein KC346_g13199 [Hortaea werneckii]KAI7608880.1 hypothetical protein KC343_g12529 [Hortaea werneckii]KAI7644379.1 hypothetical protein KC319_g12319 [Hortaea werneckii]
MNGIVADAARKGVERTNNTRSVAPHEMIDLCDDDEEINSTAPPVPSTPRTSDQQLDEPPEAPRKTTEEEPPQPSESADRYSTIARDGVEIKNPHRFCLKPPFWKRWTAAQYAQFADEIRAHFDPVPFAREWRIPVEEVRAVFYAVVCNPLYDAEEATRRGEGGVMRLMEVAKKYGTPTRRWGKPGGKRVLGEFDGVKNGQVVVIGEATGNEYHISREELSQVDEEYLQHAIGGDGLSLLGIEPAIKDVNVMEE